MVRLKVATAGLIQVCRDKFQFQGGAVRRVKKDKRRVLVYMFQFQGGAVRSNVLLKTSCTAHAFQFQGGAVRRRCNKHCKL